MDNDATLANASSQIRQKRVLPSRSRRGGPGVGNCDVDVMILNAQAHKSESEPLIPADTMFVLKTNDKLENLAMEFSSAGGSGLNLRAHESYFDRPDVLKAYREQTVIETPEYKNVGDEHVVGGRLRQRSVEENNSDIDAVYEKRHRKYETFEKRQRLREKEKLKHEQYKLKERIEQLRGMDNSAFLAAPASSFSPRPGGIEVFEEDLSLLGGLGGLNGGSPAYHEGERRRKEMLMNAQALEERYRILLPPERPKKPAGQSSVNVSTDLEPELSAKEFVRSQDEGESELDEDHTAQLNKKETQKLKLRLPARPIIVTSTIATPKVASASSSKKRRRSIPPPFLPPPPPPPKSPVPARKSRVILEAPSMHQVSSMDESGSSSVEHPPSAEPMLDTPMSHPEQPSLEILAYDPELEIHAIKRQRQHKRAKTEEHHVPSPSRDRSVPLPEMMYVEIMEDPMRTRSPSPMQSLPYSYPPPAPPPEISSQRQLGLPPPPEDKEDKYSPTPEPSDQRRASVPRSPVSPLGSSPPPQPVEYLSPVQRSSPPADESLALPNSVPPADPFVVDRAASLPPIAHIQSISAPAAPIRRGRSRAVVSKPAPPRKKPQRRVPPPAILLHSSRPTKNSRRRPEAFGVHLPAIILGSDSYEFELPPEVLDQTTGQRAQGSEGPEDSDHGPTTDDEEPEPEEDGEEEVSDDGGT